VGAVGRRNTIRRELLHRILIANERHAASVRELRAVRGPPPRLCASLVQRRSTAQSRAAWSGLGASVDSNAAGHVGEPSFGHAQALGGREALPDLRQLLPAPPPERPGLVRCPRRELVFLPTYGSWLNWIEAEFAALRYFALNGTDHHSHAEQNTAIAGYVGRRNHRAQPKVNFASDSPIRTWTHYPIKAA